MNRSEITPIVPTLAKKEKIVLDLLLGGFSRELFGLEMIAKAEGALKRGTIYVILQRMEGKGLIESRIEARNLPEVGIPRRLYRATGLGEKAWRAHQAALQSYFGEPIPSSQHS